ncbi:MAG: TerB family tellurite resistance protein [Sandaracinaceae bacterium]|nr:TerB family tellurite resistance protein [Sandaracinaceae bacterium]
MTVSDAVSHAQALAGLRVLVHVCHADGVISPAEREALAPSMDALALTETERDVLLREDVDLDAALAEVTDDEVRRAVLLAAHAIARADGAVAAEEAVIERVRHAWGLEPPALGVLDALRAQLREDFGAEEVEAVDDPVEREARIRRLVRSRAVGLAVLALIPTNLVTEAIGAFLQIQMVRTIGRYYGHAGDSKITRALVASLLGVVALHAGLEALVRLVPGWGSAIGVAANYATTWGLGWAAHAYFESGGELDRAALHDAFRSFREGGEAAYREHASEEDAWRGRATDISALTRRFVRGEIGAKELARKFKDDLGE